MESIERCSWCGSDPIYVDYHDKEWGVPIYGSQDLFAKLILDGAQAGLSWITILRKREGYYKVFDGLDPVKIARYSDKKLDKILLNPAIVRNRLKVNSVRRNACAYLEIMDGEQTFSEFLWAFVGAKPIQNQWQTMADIPTTSQEAEAMSKALKKAGFNFVGPTIVYAFMQAVGMVNDHIVSCHRYKPCKALTK